MSLRSVMLLSVFATAFSLAPAAFADVPNPTTGTGGSTTSSSTTGTGGAATNTSCTVNDEEIAGTTCQECGSGAAVSCSNLGSQYSFVCQATATVAIWCNGPARDTPSDQNVSCSVGLPGSTWSGLAAIGALAAAVAVQLRRRKS